MARGTGTGFGHYSFGHFPMGRADFGEDVVIRSFPEEYLEGDSERGDVLLHYLMTVKDSVNRTKEKIDDIPDQVDVDLVRSDILRYLGSTISITIDDSEPEEFHRSLVGNAIPMFRIKGTRESYRIRGKISGYDVVVVNMYHVAPVYLPLFEPEDIFELPIGSGEYFTDLPPGTIIGTPTEAECDYCFTAFIKLEFTVVKQQPPSASGINFFDRVVAKLRDIIPIHVREVIFELRLFIVADESEHLSGGPVCPFEDAFIPAHFWYHFDAVPADFLALDFKPLVSGYGELTDP